MPCCSPGRSSPCSGPTSPPRRTRRSRTPSSDPRPCTSTSRWPPGRPTGCSRSSSSSSGSSSSGRSSPVSCATRARRWCPSSPRSAAWSSPRRSYLAVNLTVPGRQRARVGGPDGDGHRVRGLGPRDRRPQPAERAARLPAHARGRRRPARDHRHRRGLHRVRLRALARRRARRRSSCSRSLIRRGWVSGWLLVPLGLVAWAAVHASGRPRDHRRCRPRARRPGDAGGHPAGAPARPPAAGVARGAVGARVAAAVRRRSPCPCSRCSPPG